MEVKAKELQEILGVHERTLQNFRSEGMPYHGAGRGTKYNVQECVEWYINRQYKKKLSETSQGMEILSKAEAEAAKLTYQAALAKLQLLEAEKLLVSSERVKKDLDSIIDTFKLAISSIPATWADRVLGLAERSEALDVLDELSRELLADLEKGHYSFEEEE